MIKSIALAFAALVLALPARADLERPIPVRMVKPDFPRDLLAQGVNGLVTIDCLVDAEGNVSDLKVEKFSNKAFIEPALAALRKWKFKPAQRDGDLVAIRVSIPIRFTVQS